MKAKKLKRGAYVSRSRFQKEVEKNKALMNDLKIMFGSNGEGPPSVESFKTRMKWHDFFKRQAKNDKELKEIISQFSSIVHECKGAKCTIKNCAVCKNQMY